MNLKNLTYIVFFYTKTDRTEQIQIEQITEQIKCIESFENIFIYIISIRYVLI